MNDLKQKLNSKIGELSADPNNHVIHFTENKDAIIESEVSSAPNDHNPTNPYAAALQDTISPTSTYMVDVVPDFAITIQESKQKLAMLQEFVREMMTPGVDYGIIPNCKKPSLYKAGAEKLCSVFGFAVEADVTSRYEDFDKGIFFYEVKTTLLNRRTGQLITQGLGSCNSKESKYRNQSGFSIANTILKMAHKRSCVAAVLLATRSSDIFTQDMEDGSSVNNADKYKPYEANQQEYAPHSSQPMITKEQKRTITELVNQKQIPVPYIQSLLESFGVTHTKELSQSKADGFLTELGKFMTTA